MTRYLHADDLNAAGVKNWSVRLRDARRRDAEEMRRGVDRIPSHYDREWLLVKQEYYEAAKSWPAETQHKVVPATPPREPRPFPGSTKMLTYDELYGENEESDAT